MIRVMKALEPLGLLRRITTKLPTNSSEQTLCIIKAPTSQYGYAPIIDTAVHMADLTTLGDSIGPKQEEGEEKRKELASLVLMGKPRPRLELPRIFPNVQSISAAYCC